MAFGCEDELSPDASDTHHDLHKERSHVHKSNVANVEARPAEKDRMPNESGDGGDAVAKSFGKRVNSSPSKSHIQRNWA